MPSSRESSQPRDRTLISKSSADRFFTTSAAWEATLYRQSLTTALLLYPLVISRRCVFANVKIQLKYRLSRKPSFTSVSEEFV